jgi:hypothetical protein
VYEGLPLRSQIPDIAGRSYPASWPVRFPKGIRFTREDHKADLDLNADECFFHSDITIRK